MWVLSVDLQTKTASFTTGLADAARSARGSFNDIRDGARGMGEGFQQSGQNVRAAIGLIDNTIRGSHAMAMADLIREFSNTRIVMAALPFAATVAGFAAVAGILFEVYSKVKEAREEHEKLADEQTRLSTAVHQSFGSLNDKLLEAEKRSDELRNDHLAALRKELELIDHQTLGDLLHQFDAISKEAEGTFKALHSHWWTFGDGSEGAQKSLAQFQVQYASLISQNKGDEASSLLSSRLEREQKILALQQQAAAAKGHMSLRGGDDARTSYYQSIAELQALGAEAGEKNLGAQQAIVKALREQVDATGEANHLKGVEQGNAIKQTGNEASAKASEAARQLAASQLAIAEQSLAGDRATAGARLEIARASVEQRLQSELEFAQRDMDIKLTANQAEQAALGKSGKDEANQLQELRNKALEIEAQHAAQVATLTAHASVEQNTRDIANLEAGEREKIQATAEGSAERLAAIDAAMQTAQQHALQDADFYRTLGTERVAVIRQMVAEEAKLRAEAGKESAEHEQRMGALELAALQESQTLLNSARRVSAAEKTAQELTASQAEFQLKRQALQQQMAALDESGKDYENKLKSLQNREIELVREHEDQKTAIMDQAEIQRNTRILSAETSFNSMIAGQLTQTLMRHQTFASMMTNIGNQVVSSMMQNAIQSVMANDYSKESDAAKAARKAFNLGLEIGGPAGIILGPVMGAAAFASVMAFAGGTDSVPGVGRGDVVPAMLTPGEGVVPGGVMDGLRNVARQGGFTNGPQYHVTVSPSYQISALDSAGFEDVLTKHTDTLQRHFERTMRRMNR